MLITFTSRIFEFLTTNVKLILILYIVGQLIYIFFFPRQYNSDALYYYSLAEHCYESNQFYPASEHLYEDYLVAPLYINLLIVLIHIYNSTITIGLFNLLINFLQLFFVYKITQKYFDEKTAKMSIILYILYLNTAGLVLLNYTELFFTILILGSIYFFNKKSFTALILSGILASASVAVRPAGWALIICYITIYVYLIFREKKFNGQIISLFAGVILFILLFGGFNYLHFGKIIFTSTTGPVNLLLGANDNATGGFNARVYEEGNAGYMANPDSMTYIQTSDFYFEQASEWIEQNPVNWIGLIPMKLIHTFAYDDIAVSALSGAEDWNVIQSVKNVITGNWKKTLPSESLQINVLFILLQIFHHLYYYFLVYIFIFWLANLLKKKSFDENNTIHLLFVLIGVLMIMITVGTPRYKYPFVIVMMPFIASYLKTKFLVKIEIKN